MNKIFKYIEKNFYKNTPLLGPVGIFVVGDALVLVPFLLIFFPAIAILFSLKDVAIAWTLYMSVRSFIEITYWMHHQFGSKNYRPTFFKTSLGNNEIYIIYQLLDTIYFVFYSFILIKLLTN